MSLILSGTDGLSDVDGSAATPAIRGTDTNTGIFFPAADTIAFSEGGVEVMRLDSSANLQFNSGYGSVATAYACRAWVNFNGTGTVAIRASGNVSSITDGGVGIYTVNFTTAMPDANYAVTGAVGIGFNGGESLNPVTLTTSSVQVDTTINAAKVDRANVNVAIFR
jgi:hypothetical protein